MLSTNVLCIKKRKKRTYSFSNAHTDYRPATEKNNRSSSGAVTMLQITEDTPPDMLAGAMDLTVHLPTGRSVRMAVERSTPMMDLLVQITTNHHLQLSNHTLQALGMAPSAEHSDRVLPYKPNTPIGALDTQHIKVIPKTRTLPAPKNVAPGHQPFESTFRLKVHLPRNQLYVTRVSRNVLLEDIMKKVCEEKNLDPIKYEFKHPGNLDEVLDPKLTLSDYQITEIYVVAKGTISLNQAFSTSDIMALRKEEERKQMHNKTGGGVFNLIFRRGKSSMGSGSLSSENRSISPTHSDDSRSVTPPAVQPAIIVPPPKLEPTQDRPKPPQRKRRPAPKPPQTSSAPDHEARKSCSDNDKPPSNISVTEQSNEELQRKIVDSNGLTICHSRNSSDSSGYHEASILSDNCNTSLPRRPKSAYINGEVDNKLGKLSRSTTNLTQMAPQSKSTSSLAFTGRKKKAAPPPPPALKSSNSVASLAAPSPIVASQPPAPQPEIQESPNENQENIECTLNTNPKPAPRRNRALAPPVPRPRSIHKRFTEETHRKLSQETNSSETSEGLRDTENIEWLEQPTRIEDDRISLSDSRKSDDVTSRISETFSDSERLERVDESTKPENSDLLEKSSCDPGFTQSKESEIEQIVETATVEVAKEIISVERVETVGHNQSTNDVTTPKPQNLNISDLQKNTQMSIFNSIEFLGKEPEPSKPPEVIALIPKVPSKPEIAQETKKYDTMSKKQCFQIGSSLIDPNFDADRVSIRSKKSSSGSDREALSTPNSVASALDTFDFVDEIEDLDENLFTGSESRKTGKVKSEVFNQLYGIHDYDRRKQSHGGSLRSMDSLPGFVSSNMKKWNNVEELDGISVGSGVCNKWVLGDSSDTESITSGITQNSHQDIKSNLNENKEPVCVEPPIKSNIVEKVVNHTEEPIVNSDLNESAPKIKSEDTIDAAKAQTAQKDLDLNELDWQYQLPSPPKAFRDSSPAIFTDTQTITDFKDSVVTSPELFEKLKAIEDHQSVSDLPSVVSEEDKAVFNKLSLEHLEKRKSLVYNRELATSLKMTDLESKDNKPETFTSSLTKFEATYNEVRRNSLQREEQPVTLRKSHSTVSNKTSTLPNFKITTYDNPKQKIKVFEDDTIRSNTDSSRGFKSFVETHHSSTTLSKTYIGTSMENIAYRKNSLGNQSDDDKKQTQGYSFYKPPSIPKSYVTNSGVSRSESFSTDKHWSPTKPVSRSKSHLTLNKYGIESNLQKDSEDSLTKSSSLFDVSGLQSLGVMKLIQNKLNTPTSSMENIHKPEPKPVEHIAKPVDTYKQTVTPKLYQYSGPPSINMSTWSERPKVPVSVKEDADYKLSSKLIVTTTDNFTTRNNRVEVKNNNTSSTKISSSVPSYSNNVKVNGNYVEQPLESKNVSVKINGTEPISTQHTGNVVIKIGNVSNPTPKIMDNQRFINHTTATGYRKPFSDINSSQPKQRPHSIALDSSFDISRVPVVRSVELKKPYKDFQGNNTSITQIYQTPNNFRSSTLHRNSLHEADMDNFPHMYKSIETLTNTVNNSEAKTVGRVNSYKAAPVVRGFKPNNEGVTNNNNKVLWNKPNSYSTLPSKPKASKDFIYSINKDVPFSQSNLRRTDSNKIGNGDKNDIETSNNERNNYNSLPPQVIEAIAPPPPPPQMPKIVNRRVPRHIEPVVDPREQLLSAIRNFGGKKGLKTAKA